MPPFSYAPGRKNMTRFSYARGLFVSYLEPTCPSSQSYSHLPAPGHMEDNRAHGRLACFAATSGQGTCAQKSGIGSQLLKIHLHY